jgi:hypothetical protein
MMPRITGAFIMVTIDEVVDFISRMAGSRHVFPLRAEAKENLIKIEESVKATFGINCSNQGVMDCLARENIIVIIKDSRFRPPPEPTVLLMADDGMIIGKEIFPEQRAQYLDREDVIFLSDEFILFPELKAKGKERFVMPPVSFPEVEKMSGTKNVVSCSPSPPGDMFVRSLHGLPDDPKLASVLVGYDDA